MSYLSCGGKALIVETGTISARGQVAIPAKVRRRLELSEGEQIIFFCDDNQCLIKKISRATLDQLLKPLHDAPKKIKEEEVVDLIHKLRKKWRAEKQE